MQYSYLQLVGMVMRLVDAGMTATLAVKHVSLSYGVDSKSLSEWVSNHLDET